MKKIFYAVLAFLAVMCFSLGASAADYVYSASVDGVLSLHISPSDESYKITDVPACSKMRLIKTERTWGLVEFNNKCGWINLSFTRDTYDKAAQSTGNDSQMNVRVNSSEEKAILYNVPSLSASLGSEEKYMVPNDMILEITRETKSGWGLATMNGKYAWIQMKDTKKYETDAQKTTDKYGIYYVYVLSDGGKGLSLTEKAGGGTLYAVIPDCIKLTVRETKGNYAYVSYNGINGWIDLRNTAQSLSNAQSNAGALVNVEYEVAPENGAESAKILSVPSEKEEDGGYIVDEIKAGEAVFVLRSTLGGWSLVNRNGNLGWIAPGFLAVSQPHTENMTEVLSSPREGYVFTDALKGMKLFAARDGETTAATVPECVKVKIIAEKDGYEYVYCDFASGWANSGQTVQTLSEALEKNSLKKKEYYIIEEETGLMSLPTYSELCQSNELSLLSEGTFFEVSKIVYTGKRRWALTSIDGVTGFVNLGCAKETTSPAVMIACVLLTAIVLISAAFVIYRIIMKKRKGR